MDERVKNKDEEIKSPRKIIQKSIEKVSKCFLKRVDNYFDNIESVDIPSSKIEGNFASMKNTQRPSPNPQPTEMLPNIGAV